MCGGPVLEVPIDSLKAQRRRLAGWSFGLPARRATKAAPSLGRLTNETVPTDRYSGICRGRSMAKKKVLYGIGG